MDPITMILTAISGIKLILNNPALGGGSSVRLDEASELLGILAMIIEQGDDGLDDLREFTALIQAMVKEGRAPTQVEWDTWRSRSDAAHDRLQRVKAELLGEEEPEPEPTPEPEPEVVTDPEPNTIPELREPNPGDPEPDPPPTG